jgi:hypothetical protein
MYKHTKWTRQLVAEHFEEAVYTTRKLPAVRVQGYFNAWPDIKYTPRELMLMETRAIKMQATPDAISRLEQALQWMQWLTVLERKLVWRRAAKMSWKSICLEFSLSQAGASYKWRHALTKISSYLNSNAPKLS